MLITTNTITPESPFQFQCGSVTVTRKRERIPFIANVITDREQFITILREIHISP